MPYRLEINIYQGPFAKPQYKTVRSRVAFPTKAAAELEVPGASRFWGSAKVVRTTE
jgi:hypothetical protein